MEKSNTTFTKYIFDLFTTRIPGLEFVDKDGKIVNDTPPNKQINSTTEQLTENIDPNLNEQIRLEQMSSNTQQLPPPPPPSKTT